MVTVGNLKIWRVNKKIIIPPGIQPRRHSTHYSVLCVCVCECVCVLVCKQTSFFFVLGSVTRLMRTSENTRSQNWLQLLRLLELPSLEEEETRSRTCLRKVPGKWAPALKAQVMWTSLRMGQLSLWWFSGTSEATPWAERTSWRVLERGDIPYLFLRLSKSTSQPVPSHKALWASVSSSVMWWSKHGQDLQQDQPWLTLSRCQLLWPWLSRSVLLPPSVFHRPPGSSGMDPDHWFSVVLDTCCICISHTSSCAFLPRGDSWNTSFPSPSARGPQAHPTPAPSETLTHPQDLSSHPPALPWALASEGSPVTGVWWWVHPLRTLHFGNISLALGASGFFKPETVLLERLFRRWYKMRYCSCVLGSRHAQKASNVLPHLDLTPWQPAEQGSFQVKTRSRGGDETGSRPLNSLGTELHLESRTSGFPSYMVSTANLQEYCCFIY